MAKKLETSDISAKQLEDELGIGAYNIGFDQIMRLKETGRYLLTTFFIETKKDPRETILKDILDYSSFNKNTITEQYKLAKRANGTYMIHVISPDDSTEFRMVSKIIAVKDLETLDTKEIIFNSKVDFMKWFTPLNNACTLPEGV